MIGGALKPVLVQLLLPPAGLLWLMLAGTVLAWRWHRAGLALATAAAGGLWLLGCHGFALWLSAWCLPAVAPLDAAAVAGLRQAGVQAIVVLGGGVEPWAAEYAAPQASGHTASRLRYGIHLARATGLPLAFSGGSGWAQPDAPPEGELARQLAQADYGTPLRWVESHSRNTAENASHTRALLAAEQVRRIALVTNAWHMPRARQAFMAQGFAVTAAPMGFLQPRGSAVLEWTPGPAGWTASHTVLREWLGLLVQRWQRAAGQADS